jgi:hypothetical protein
MRTSQKDIRRTTVLTTMAPIIDAANGNGIWSDGTPWHMVRTATGEYTMYFDSRIFVLSGSIGPNASGRHYYKFEVVSAGQVRVQVLDSTGAAESSANFDVTINVLDTRT